MMFDCPRLLDGEIIENSEEYNKKIISLTGVIGVPFA